MLLLGTAASNALDLLALIQPHKNAQTDVTGPAAPGNGQTSFINQVGPNGPGDAVVNTAAAATTGSSLLGSNVLGFLILNQAQQSATSAGTGAQLSPSQSRLFAKLDTNGDGAISKSELEAALGGNGNTAAADALFSKLDRNGDGVIDQSEFAAVHHGDQQQHDAASADQASADSTTDTDPGASSKAHGASSKTTNPDGSTTTTITYTDGSKITLTTPPQVASNASAIQPTTGSTNILETLISLQAQLFATPTVPISSG